MLLQKKKRKGKEMEGGGGVRKMWRSVFVFRGKVIERGMNPRWKKPLSACRLVWRWGKKGKNEKGREKEKCTCRSQAALSSKGEQSSQPIRELRATLSTFLFHSSRWQTESQAALRSELVRRWWYDGGDYQRKRWWCRRFRQQVGPGLKFKPQSVSCQSPDSLIVLR